MIRLIVLVVVLVSLGYAGLYDLRQRRRGSLIRASDEVETESMHNRLDLNAVPYEPVRQPGQHDWATYRKRDRKPPRE